MQENQYCSTTILAPGGIYFPTEGAGDAGTYRMTTAGANDQFPTDGSKYAVILAFSISSNALTVGSLQQNSNGREVIPFNIPANGNFTAQLPPEGIRVPTGFAVTISGGANVHIVYRMEGE